MEDKKLLVLSIDAWGEDDGWSWNAWYKVGTIDKKEFDALVTDKEILMWMRNHGFTSTADKKLVAVEDDQYNKVIVAVKDRRPLYAIEYGGY